MDNSNLPPSQQTRGVVERGRFFRQFTTRYTGKQFQIRTDHRLTSRDQLTIRFLSDVQDQPLGGSRSFEGFDGDYAADYKNFLIAESHVFSSSLTNELRLAYNKIQFGFPLSDPDGPASTLPTLSFTGFTALGAATNLPQGRTAHNYQVQDTVTKIFGDHTIRTGVDYLRQIATQIAPANIRGSITYGAGGGFQSLGNFVDDFGGTGNTQKFFGSQTYFPSLHRIAVFAHDRWKASSSLTLTGGLRYENFGTPFNTLRTPAFTGLFNVDPVTRQGPFDKPNSVKADNNNFAPSVGLAYAPSSTDGISGFIFGERKTVFRAGFNIGYDSFFNNIASNAAASSPNGVI
ncbi:MAG: TonB-dependent receptor, partial [Acidobacteria bacterium]|nr:TonB-dependent receptor [Acidobacteriota bacterium]